MGCMGSREERIIYNTVVKNEGKDQKISGPYGNSRSGGDLGKFYKEYEKSTVIEILQESFRVNANSKCCGWREAFINDKKEVEFKPEFKTINYRDMWEHATKLSKLIVKLGLAPVMRYEKEDKYDAEEGEYKVLGFFARNCMEWLAMDIACQLDSITSATFYSTLGEESFEHVFNQTLLETVCISPENIANLTKYFEKYRFKSLKNIILFDYTQHTDPEQLKKFEDKFKEFNINIYYYSKLVATKMEDIVNVKTQVSGPNTLFTLCYTSGTTNLPKGVKITQKMLGCLFFSVMADVSFVLTPNDVHFSYLPLAHVMERLVSMGLLGSGSSIYFISGEAKKYLSPELLLVRPTFMFAVPRILSLFKTLIIDKFSKLTGFAKTMADKALASKEANYDNSGAITHWFYDSFVFNKVRDQFGGRLKAFIVGSAPLPVDLAKSIKILFSIPIIEAYGMTETTGAICGSNYFDNRNLNCGGCFRSLNMKLVDVPEMNYHSQTSDLNGNHSPTGEICVKGLNITEGYFRDKKNTVASFDEDGWFHTGDVGRIMFEDKGIKIIDRVKEIFKLAQGEYIAPSKLEGAYSLSPYVEQICIHGDSEHTFVVAIIYPSRLRLKQFLDEKGLLTREDKLDRVDEFFEKDVLQDEMRASFNKIAKEKNFNSLERISKMIICKEMFTQDNGLLTESMKMKRKSFQTKFAKEIDNIYNKEK